MQTFELEGYDFIELNKLMKIMNLVGSGGEAKQFIDEGLVLVNGQVEKQRRKKLRTGDVVSFEGEEVKVQ
ncbi:RNA-binding S4 domain-containing protein [Ekhidna sp. MALMAid0563]|uniref:RNA-binding S4 domain-containing protein n=1 Tax=Ekhidna sp. MALMAid0563 TaxID=3143937 RepID=UPI0032DF16A2